MRHQRAIDLLGIAAHVARANQVQAQTYGPKEAANSHAETLADYRAAIAVLTADAQRVLACRKTGERKRAS